MVDDKNKIIELLMDYISEVRAKGFEISAAYLFGSYAKGNAEEWSDIDIALISEDFEGNRFFDKEKIREAKFAIDYRISPFPYRPEDFTESWFARDEIVKHGIRVL